jgi:hypothetical protein
MLRTGDKYSDLLGYDTVQSVDANAWVDISANDHVPPKPTGLARQNKTTLRTEQHHFQTWEWRVCGGKLKNLEAGSPRSAILEVSRQDPCPGWFVSLLVVYL